MTLRYLFLVIGSFGLFAALTHAEVDEKKSPYNPQEQKNKENSVIEQYFNSRDTMKEAQALLGISGAAEGTEDGESRQDPASINGVNEENFKGPSRNEAIQPIDAHAIAAQNALNNDLKQTGDVDRYITQKEADVVREAGDPDSPKELKDRLRAEKGLDIKPDFSMNYDEVQRSNLYYATMGP